MRSCGDARIAAIWYAMIGDTTGEMFRVVSLVRWLAERGETMTDGIVPAVGARFPAFSLTGTDNTAHALGDLVGEKGIILFFFPKVDTGG